MRAGFDAETKTSHYWEAHQGPCHHGQAATTAAHRMTSQVDLDVAI